MAKDSNAKRKLTAHLLKKEKIKEKDIPSLLSDIHRFVNVVQRIYTEPQAQIKIVEKKINGEKIKQRVIEADLEEISKVRDKNAKKENFGKVIRRFNREVTKKK